MSQGPRGAGGDETSSVPRFRPLTQVEKKEIRELFKKKGPYKESALKTANLLLIWLKAHPDVRVDEILSNAPRGDRDSIFTTLLYDAYIPADHAVFEEVVRRYPNPTIRGYDNLTPLEYVEQRAAPWKEFAPALYKTFWEPKIELARRVEDIPRKKKQAKDLMVLEIEARRSLNPVIQSTLAPFLVGGPEPADATAQMNERRAEFGMKPLPPPKKEEEKKGGRRRTKRRGQKRKTRRRRH